MAEPGSSPARPEPPGPELVQVLVDHHRQFLAFLERRVGNRALAEDILQEAFVRGMDRITHVRDDESIVAWFYRVLRNAVIDHQRRAKVASRGLDVFALEVARHVEPDAETTRAICRCVAELAETLKPEYRNALRRVELDGFSLQQLADESGISSGNAAVRVFRARAALRKQVARCCGTCADHGCVDCTCGSGKGP